jgi:photosystem II stability/assembly factor-like uncharacterized protein
MVSNDGGTTWTEATVPTGIGTGALRSVACTSALDCIAVGANVVGETDSTLPGLAIETSDGGATWQAESMPAGTAAVDQIVCSNASQCFAGGSSESVGGLAAFASSEDGGATWKAVAAPTGMSDIAGMSCPALNKCVVVGRSNQQPITVQTSNGQSWTPTAVPQS